MAPQYTAPQSPPEDATWSHTHKCFTEPNSEVEGAHLYYAWELYKDQEWTWLYYPEPGYAAESFRTTVPNYRDIFPETRTPEPEPQQLITPNPSYRTPGGTTAPETTEEGSISAVLAHLHRASTPRDTRTAQVFSLGRRTPSTSNSPASQVTALPTVATAGSSTAASNTASVTRPVPIRPTGSAVPQVGSTGTAPAASGTNPSQSGTAGNPPSQQPPPQQSGNPTQTVVTMSKPVGELEHKALFEFHGDRNKAPHFISTAETYFAVTELTNSLSDEVKVNFVLTHMNDGEAATWATAKQQEALHNKTGFSFGTWKDFAKEFRNSFISAADQEDARLQITRYKQGTQTISQYTTNFQSLLSRCNFDKPDEHCALYKQGLTNKSINMIHVNKLPDTLAGWYQLMREYERTHMELLGNQERNYQNRSYGNNNQRSGSTNNNAKTTGNRPAKLTPAERAKCIEQGLCFRCRQSGHSAANCPNSGRTPSGSSQTPAQGKNIRAADTDPTAENKAPKGNNEPKDQAPAPEDKLTNIRRLFAQLSKEERTQYFTELEKEDF